MLFRRILLTTRKVSDKDVEKIKTHFVFNNFCSKNDMWKNIVQAKRPQMTIWCVRIPRWIPKATNTHSYATMVARKRLSFTLYIYCVSFLSPPPPSPRIRLSLYRSIPYKFKSVVEQAKIQNTHFVIPLA
jgi:hypothetical protein